MNHKDTKAQRTTRLNVSTLGLESGENPFDRMTRHFQPQIVRISTDFHLFFLIFVSSQYSGAKKFDFYQKSNFWVDPPRFIEKILIFRENP